MWWPSTTNNTISAVPGFSQMWNVCNCVIFRFKSQLAEEKMYNSRQIIWPFPVILLFPWARSRYCLIKVQRKIPDQQRQQSEGSMTWSSETQPRLGRRGWEKEISHAQQSSSNWSLHSHSLERRRSKQTGRISGRMQGAKAWHLLNQALPSKGFTICSQTTPSGSNSASEKQHLHILHPERQQSTSVFLHTGNWSGNSHKGDPWEALSTEPGSTLRQSL